MSRLLGLILLMGLFISGCTPMAKDYEQVSPQEKIVLKFSHVVSDTSPKGRAAIRWAELVSRRSEGRVELQVFPNSSLYKDGEELEALKKGYVQIIAPATSKLTKVGPIWQLLDLPFFFNRAEEVHRVVDGGLTRDLTNSLQPIDAKLLAFWDNGFKQMTANQPLRRVEDFKGVRFRIMNSPVLFAQYTHLGAQPVVTPFSDAYSVLESGHVGGSENTLSNLYSKRLYQQHVTISNHGYLGYAVIVNAKQWGKLPGSVRQLLTETLEEVTDWEREEAMKQNNEDLNRIQKDSTTQVYFLSPKEIQQWRKALAPLRQEVEAIIGEEIIRKAEADKEKRQ